MFSKKQKIAFVVITTVVVGAIGLVFSINTEREIHEEKREKGAIGKRTTLDKKLWLNKAISFKKTTRKNELEQLMVMEPLVEEIEEKPKKTKKQKKVANKDSTTTKAGDTKGSNNNNTVAVRMVDGRGPIPPHDGVGELFETAEGDNIENESPYGNASGYIAGGAVGTTPSEINTPNSINNTTICALGTLIGSPSLETTSRCIDEYNAGRVSEADFYSAVSNMLQSESVLVRRHGLFALAGTPNTRSFKELVNQKNNSPFDNVTSAAEQSLGQYSSSHRRAKTINQVLDDNDVLVKIEAIKVAKDLAQKYLSLEDGGEGQQREIASGRANIDTTEYEKIAEKLTELSTSSDEELKEVASEAQSFIADLLEKYKTNNAQDTRSDTATTTTT